MQFWNEMEGKTVAGLYPLGRLLQSAGRSAWFETRDDKKAPRVILITESLNDEDRLLKNLEAASRVKHPNVVSIGQTGQARIDDKPVVYAILEPAGNNLSEGLRDRALTPDETAKITRSLVAGLGAIQAAGLFHGQLSAASVLASGDTVKLRSDCLQTVAPEDRAEAFAQDNGDLGATVFEALTQRKLTTPDDPAIDKLPAPFGSIVRNAVHGRWGLAEIATALEKPSSGATRPAVATAAAVAAEASSQPVTKPLAKPAEEVKTAPAIAPAAAPAKRVDVPAPVAAKPTAMPDTTPTKPDTNPDATPTDERSGRSGLVRILAIILLVAAVGMIWYFYKVSSGGSRSAENSPSSPASTVAPATEPPPPTTTVAPPTPAPVVTASPSKPNARRGHADVAPTALTEAAATDRTSTHAIWRVVVYAYGRQVEAQTKADALNTAHPDWKPEVFSQTGHAPWLVTLGGSMDRADALRLDIQVKKQGMPHDTYAQNFTH